MNHSLEFTVEDVERIAAAMSRIGEAFTVLSSVLAGAGERMANVPAPTPPQMPGVIDELHVNWPDSPPSEPTLTKTIVERLDEVRTEVKKPAPVFKPAGQAYPDLPRCGTCERPMRPVGSKAKDWPGTINRINLKLCGSCYARNQYRENAAAKRAERAKAETAAPAAETVLVEPPKLVLPEAPKPVAPTPAELKQAREAKEREAQAEKRKALKAEARHQEKVDAAAEREARLQRELDSFLAARHKRGVPPEGVVMPGEQPDKPYAGKS